MTTENNQKGESAVEFALVLPLLLFVLFGVIEFSILMYDKAVLTNAGREGARRGILMGPPRTSPAEMAATVDAYCASNLITFGAAVSPTTNVSAACVNPGDYITVTVTYPYTFFLLPNFMSSPPITLTAVSSMRCE